MDNQAMKDALLAANTALVEKLGKQPLLRLTLILDGEFWHVGGAYLRSWNDGSFDGTRADTPEAAFAAVMTKISEIPTPEEQALRTFHKKVAEAIDFGNENGIAADWVNPLIVMSRALSENALTHSEGAA